MECDTGSLDASDVVCVAIYALICKQTRNQSLVELTRLGFLVMERRFRTRVSLNKLNETLQYKILN